MTLVCGLEALLSLAILALILVVLWWVLTGLLGALGVAVPGQILTILKWIGVLVVLIYVVRLLLVGDACGVLGWPRMR